MTNEKVSRALADLLTLNHTSQEGYEAAAAVHRGWINLKSLVTGGQATTDAVLEACETGEATALKAYETALGVEGLPQDLKSVLTQQHGQILQAKNQVTALKSGS